MSRIASPARGSRLSSLKLMASVSVTSMSLALSLNAAAVAQEAPFGTMVGMQAGRITLPNGQMSQWSGANAPVIGTDADGRPLMSIEQTKSKALLDWEDFRLQTNEVLEFKQQSADWIAVNRVHGEHAAEIHGEIRAPGKVFVFNDNGVLIGDDAIINTRALVVGKGVSDVDVDGNVTTITQSSEKATLDWSNMSVQTGEVLKFKQEQENWIALNRSMSADVTSINGNVEADGNIYLVAPSGIEVNGNIDAQQVVVSSLYMRDEQFENGENGGLVSYHRVGTQGAPTFSNTWYYGSTHVLDPEEDQGYVILNDKTLSRVFNELPVNKDPDNPIRHNVVIGEGSKITARDNGKIMVFGTQVTNRGHLYSSDEGQIILAAGENIFIQDADELPSSELDRYGFDHPGMLLVSAQGFYPIGMLDLWNNENYAIGAYNPPENVVSEELLEFWQTFYDPDIQVGDYIDRNKYRNETRQAATEYFRQKIVDLYQEMDYTVRNEGILELDRGGRVDMHSLTVEQMGVIDITSTALFRGEINIGARLYNIQGRPFNDDGTKDSISFPGNGTIVFGENSLTQITPDLDATDTLPRSTDEKQFVGELRISGNKLNMEKNSIIYLPSGKVDILLDAGQKIFNDNIGPGGNGDSEDGSRFYMDAGATIDLSGWNITREMGYHQVSGKLFAAQLSDSPVQRDGELYREEIKIDRRYGTNVANWDSFDNLSELTLSEFLVDGGSIDIDVGDDFIMRDGSIIDVSGGVITYEEGFVQTTLLRRLDGTVIDIREADPDELYMGLANEWVDYDLKWGQQETYYVPLVSSSSGRFETSYTEGGDGGIVRIFAPDAVLQGTMLGHTSAGRYQRQNLPQGAILQLGSHGGESENDYLTNQLIIEAEETLLSEAFGFESMLGSFFGEEYDPEDEDEETGFRFDNATIVSTDFFKRSSMGVYELRQRGHRDTSSGNPEFHDTPGILLEEGADLVLPHGGSIALLSEDQVHIYGNITTEGGDISIAGAAVRFGDDTVINTRGSWYSDYELFDYVPLSGDPRIDGGDLTVNVYWTTYRPNGMELHMPETMQIDLSGGAWVNREGDVTGGRGGDLTITSFLKEDEHAEIGGIYNARSFGIGGNGALSVEFSTDVFIGHELPTGSAGQAPDLEVPVESPIEDPSEIDPEAPVEEPEEEPIEVSPNAILLTPDFFENSGFSSISLLTSSQSTGSFGITLLEGTEIKATPSSLVMNESSLNTGDIPSYYAESGTDIYEVASVKSVAQGLRPEALRRGMDITLRGSGGVVLQEGSQLGVEIGGSVTIEGSATIAGTILTPAGHIDLSKTQNVTVTETGSLLAPGASLITWRGLDSLGNELVDGVLYDGGLVELGSGSVTLREGATIDVSGTSATFDIREADEFGNNFRRPVTLASNGGRVAISAVSLNLENPTFVANAGGESARGGSFSFNWAQQAGGGSDVDYSRDINNAERFFDDIAGYFSRGDFTDADGVPYGSIYGQEISEFYYFGTPFILPEPVFFTDRNDALSSVYDYFAGGLPPMLLIGDPGDEPIASGGPVEIEPGLLYMYDVFGLRFPTVEQQPQVIETINLDSVHTGGFSSFELSSQIGVGFVNDVTIGGRAADGSYLYDQIIFDTPNFIAPRDTNVLIEGGIVELTLDPLLFSSASSGSKNVPNPQNPNASIAVNAGTLLQIGNANLTGFGDVNLTSGGDIRFSGVGFGEGFGVPTGSLATTGLLTMKADQIYAGSGRVFEVASDVGIVINAQDDGGPINDSPFEAAADLTLTAPTITQGGTLRSPLGTLTLNAYDNGEEGSGVVTLLEGSLTSVSAEGKIIPYGYTSNGDTWIDPFLGNELEILPEKTVNLEGSTIDFQDGATVDIQGGGDLVAREFVPGTNGTHDWLTGYYTERTASEEFGTTEFAWIEDGSEVYAVVPGFSGLSPLGFGESDVGYGNQVYLSGGSGLEAGYYTLLPAEYALLPGAYRVSAKHRYNDQYEGLPLGTAAVQTDGSSIQAGFFVDGASGAVDQRTTGFHVMNGETLATRSKYAVTAANNYFTSEAYFAKALRLNRPVGDAPRSPIDAGSLIFRLSEGLTLDGEVLAEAGEGGRGGFVDFETGNVVVAGIETDLTAYEGYVVLDSEKLSDLGVGSVLIGGSRKQGESNIELTATAGDVVVDNAGTVFSGGDIILASTGDIDVKSGSSIAATGEADATFGDIVIKSVYDEAVDTKGSPTNFDDDETIHTALDRGAVLRVSNGEQIAFIRDGEAVANLTNLKNDPALLAAVNTQRAAVGLAPLVVEGGLLTIADSASILTEGSIALDSTVNTVLSDEATLEASQLSAAASRISIGDTSGVTNGLVLSSALLEGLANARDLVLKSYSTIDIYGGQTITATDSLALDGAEIRVLGADGVETRLEAGTLILGNTGVAKNGGAAGGGKLVLVADNLYVSGKDKAISGINQLTVNVAERVIGEDDNTLYIDGDVDISAGGLITDSGARLLIDAAGDILVASNGNTAMSDFDTFGGTFGLTGNAVSYGGQVHMTGGTINLRARGGDLNIDEGSILDVTSNVSQFFDREIGVDGGSVNLIADAGDVVVGAGALVDVSGTDAGGAAGELSIVAGGGSAIIDGTVRGEAIEGEKSGSFRLLTASLAETAPINGVLDAGGFREARSFEITSGDVRVTGSTEVKNFELIANDGSISVDGTITAGANGTVNLAATQNVNLASTAYIRAVDGSVALSTAGANGGTISTTTGSVIDVSGPNTKGSVHLRAPIVANDVAIGALGGSIIGAKSVTAEGFLAFNNIDVIDSALITSVSTDASSFMTANGAAIQSRLGGDASFVIGIELRNDGDMELADDWDLAPLRFDGAPGVLTLRAAGDLLINANLSDGFVGDLLMDSDSWSYNLTAGANLESPNVQSVLTQAQIAGGKGSLIIGGTPDTIEYFFDPAYGNDTRLYATNIDGTFGYGGSVGLFELERDSVTGQYRDYITGDLIEKDPVTGEYVDTDYYAKRALPWVDGLNTVFPTSNQDGSTSSGDVADRLQWDNSTGYIVRTGTGSINLAAGADFVLSQRPSVVYTAGEEAAVIDGFFAPHGAQYGSGGGDITIAAAGDIVASSQTPQLPAGYIISRGEVDQNDQFYVPAADRAYDQTTWYINYDNFQGGIGALGGGNVQIRAGGDVHNLSVAIPDAGRVTGGYIETPGEEPLERTLYRTGGGDLQLNAGGNLYGGAFYVADGIGDINIGGRVTSGSTVKLWNQPAEHQLSGPGLNYDFDPRGTDIEYGLYTMVFTSRGDVTISAGGDLMVEGAFDPILASRRRGEPSFGNKQVADFLSMTEEASLNLFSAGGDVVMTNQAFNISLAYEASLANPDWIPSNAGVESSLKGPLHYYGEEGATGSNYTLSEYRGFSTTGFVLRPGDISMVAAAGNVQVVGGFIMMPSPTGNLEMLAREDVLIGENAEGYGTVLPIDWGRRRNDILETKRYDTEVQGIFMSQAPLETLLTPTNMGAFTSGGLNFIRNASFIFRPLESNTGVLPFLFSNEFLPDLHVGDTEPVRIYAVNGDVITSSRPEERSQLTIPKQLWVKAGKNVYFPDYEIQHNNATDVSIVRAGEGIYFGDSNDYGSQNAQYTDTTRRRVPGKLEISGPGRLEIEAGTDIWIPDNTEGIVSKQVEFVTRMFDPNPTIWQSDRDAADIAISAGYNQQPDYAAFDAAYLDPTLASEMVDYLIDEDTGLSLYLFDREYERASGAQGDFAEPEMRQGLVNYVRELQGLAPLESRDQEVAYLEDAWANWETLNTDFKTPFYRDVLFLEVRTTGREANDRDSDRYNTTFRGYDAIATLFPGAQNETIEGEFGWDGEFRTFASRVISSGGGDIEFVVPGGSITLADVSASAAQTGQPTDEDIMGDALRSGVITTNGGEVNVLTHGNLDVNASRILTSKGGNVLVWSSWGDIAAGLGAKTSISPQFYAYDLDDYGRMTRSPVGLPTGAGIGTLATQEGTPPADVDLIAPAGIIDAGDAGIRVSGNFNVFAVEILGTDNIDVSGVATGLPTPPATPPTALDLDTNDKDELVDKALDDALRQVQQNRATTSPSLIDVQIVEDPCADGADSEECQEDAQSNENTSSLESDQNEQHASMDVPLPEIRVDMPAQPLEAAVRKIGDSAKITVLYDPEVLEGVYTKALNGVMSPDKALAQMLSDEAVTVKRTGPRALMLERVQ